MRHFLASFAISSRCASHCPRAALCDSQTPKVYLRAKKTPELCALHMDLASLLPRSTILGAKDSLHQTLGKKKHRGAVSIHLCRPNCSWTRLASCDKDSIVVSSTVRIPNLGKGHRQSWLDMASHPFEPCLPLCYGKLTPGHQHLMPAFFGWGGCCKRGARFCSFGQATEGPVACFGGSINPHCERDLMLGPL